MTQYRTLGEGDRRLPGWQVYAGDLPEWVAGDPARDGFEIMYSDLEYHEYRVPCSATVAPDGYEVVDRGRLPEGAGKVPTWLYWQAGQWVGVDGSGLMYTQNSYAAPADELRELYAQGDAEREQPATVRWRMLGEGEAMRRDDEWTNAGSHDWVPIPVGHVGLMPKQIAEHHDFAFRRRVEPVEQPAPAPASPWVRAKHRQPPKGSWSPVRQIGHEYTGWYSDGRVELRTIYEWYDFAAVDRLAAENAELRADRDDARGQVLAWQQYSWSGEETRRKLEAERDEARADMLDWQLSSARSEEQLKAALAEVERLRGVVDAARAALEGRSDG